MRKQGQGTDVETQSRLHPNVLGDAVKLLSEQLSPRLPPKLLHPHENISDKVLVALEVLRLLHKHPYRTVWFTLLRHNVFPELPSHVQIHLRLERLGGIVDTWNRAPLSTQASNSNVAP